MRNDRERILGYKAQIEAWTGGVFDEQRMLGVVSCTYGAEQYLGYTIPHMLRQVGDAGYRADILLGFNSGFTSPATLETLAALPDVEVVPLYAPPRPSALTAARSWSTPTFAGAPVLLRAPADPQRHRVFVVHQSAGPHSQGKIRMLSDIFLGLLLPSMAAGWRPPVHTLLFDAESIFIVNQAHPRLDAEMEKIKLLQRKIPNDLDRLVGIILQAYGDRAESPPRSAFPADATFALGGAGLDVLLQALDADPGLDITGAITKFCVYSPQEETAAGPLHLPDFSQPCSTLHMWCNYTWGSVPSMRCMPGGGTLGRTLAMASIMAAITDSFTNVRAEDALLTVLAKPAGFHEELCAHVYVTNRCPGLAELTNHTPPRPAWLQQFVRWYSAVVAVDRRYGAEYTKDVIGPESGYMTSILAIFAQTLKLAGDTSASLKLLQTFLSCEESYTMMLQYALQEPLSLVGADNQSAW